MPNTQTQVYTDDNTEILDSRENFLQLGREIYKLKAIYFGYWELFTSNQVHVFVVDKNDSNPRQFLLKLNLVAIGQLYWVAKNTGVETFTNKSKFDAYVEKTKKLLLSADSTTKTNIALFKLRFV